MTRRDRIRTAAISTPLVAALLYIALNWYRMEPAEVWVGAGPEASRNPYLAYSRLLDRMGASVRTLKGPTDLGELPRDATLLLASHRLAYLTPGRLRRLTAWVEGGGHLVLEVEPFGIDDPLLEALGVERQDPKTSRELRRRPPPAAAPGKSAEPAYTMSSFEWPRAQRPLQVRFAWNWLGLRDRYTRPVLAQVRERDHTIAMAFAMGRGQVSVLPSLSFLGNSSIGSLDHAEFGWLIASTREPRAPVLLFLRMDSPPFLDWLWREAWAVVLAAALLVALWLVRVIPRFGPLAPDAPPVRRSLIEHVVASGRFLWSRGEGDYLLEALRERVLGAARRRGIATLESSPPKVAAALAGLASLSEPTVRVALTGDTRTPADFIASAAALHRIESRLAQRRSPNPLPRDHPS
jgi:hypothetical protein